MRASAFLFNSDSACSNTDLESAVSRQSWEWLVDLAPRLDIIIEMVDSGGLPVFPVGSSREAAAFRVLLTTGEPRSLRAAMRRPFPPRSRSLSQSTVFRRCVPVSPWEACCSSRGV